MRSARAARRTRSWKDQLKHSVPEGSTPDNTVIAYEPVWAIGTARLRPKMTSRTCTHISARKLRGIRLLYGGSVKASNAKEILHLPNVDGVLVGGASLKVEEFWAIAEAC